jgi:hypothetical protein
MPDLNQTQWRGFADNPAVMKSVFAEVDPYLSAVRLTGMDSGDCGSCLRLKLALHCARTKPPAAWKRINADSVSIELQCFGLQELSVTMQPGDSTVTCDITQDTAGNRVLRVVGRSIDLLIRCGFLRINHILPYTAEPPALNA